MRPAHEHEPSVVPFRERAGPGPDQLPGIEGFYVLSARGELGRYQAGGGFLEEPGLTRTLGTQIETLLRHYRTGNADELAIGLITQNNGNQPWRCASQVLSDGALRGIFNTGNDPRTLLTAFQKRNKIKSVYQGMELVLDAHKPSQPQYPRFCPVLFAPEVDNKTLTRRYGVDEIGTGQALEVLDLFAPLAPEAHHEATITGMVKEMRQARITPELRRPSELMLVEDAHPSSHVDTDRTATSGDASSTNPWEGLPEDRDTCFNDGDPVNYWLLGWFSPFNELNDLQRQFIARGHTIMKQRAGTTLVERGSREDLSIYLVEGTLELEAFDGRMMAIVGGTRRAHLPVSQLRPHAYTVRAATDVTVILFSQVMVREITRITTTYRSRPGIEVTEDVSLPDSIKQLAYGSNDSG